MLSDLKQRYAEAEVEPAFLRLYTADDELGRMCAHFHGRLNKLFDFMNYKAGTNKHFNADDSRDLISLIDEIKEAKELLDVVGIDFAVKQPYEEAIRYCRPFLRTSGGSAIPEDFVEIELVKWSPVFTLPEGMVRVAGRNDAFPLQMVGEGAFAIVYKYEDPEYGIPFAVKRARKNLGAKDLQRFTNEFELLKSLRFPYVLEVYRFDAERHQYTMEYCDSTLYEYIKTNNANLKFETRKRLALQVLYGLNYIHGKGHLHRDVSANNVLVKRYDSPAVVAKISDFGLFKAQDSTLTRTDSEMRGTVRDPAVASFKDYGTINEIYSIGFVLSYIFSGKQGVAGCTGDVRAIVDRCVNSDTSARYKKVIEITRDVEALKPKPNERSLQATA